MNENGFEDGDRDRDEAGAITAETVHSIEFFFI